MTLKLGTRNSEIDIEQKSLSFPSVNKTDNNIRSYSSNKTLYVTYINGAKIFTLQYDVISRESLKTLEDIYELQQNNLQSLSYIKEEGNELKNYSVYMSPISYGAEIRRDLTFYNSVTITLEERLA
ncbi:MAG: hypothetical protein GY777_24300 [Candidatus Brocadiaceae bacterium]|nr:hypothetical protein [Candidatus Brocadiaceae bacterium]